MDLVARLRKRAWRRRARASFARPSISPRPNSGTIQIACDDSYELYVNGRQIGTGQNWKVLDVYDITKYLVQGTNTVAVKAVNTEQGSAGLVARVVVKQQGNTHVEYSTDATWKTALKEFPQWQKARFDDAQWLAARSFGSWARRCPGATKWPSPAPRDASKSRPNSTSNGSSIPRTPAR